MKEISHLIRLAYLDILDPLVVEGVTIPVSDMAFNPNQNVATYRSSKAYVLIREQNEVETTNNDCTFRQTATINLDIITKFPMGSGGRLPCELISNEVQDLVHSLTGQNIVINDTGFQVLDTRKVFANTFEEPGQSVMVYRKRLTFAHTVYQSANAVAYVPQNTLNLSLNSIL